MLIENQFTVSTPPDELWAFLLDVERIAPCMPGAELTETVDERNWKGKVNVKLGPLSLAFAGQVAMEERDDASHRVVLAAKGMEQKGKGAATAKVTSWLEPAGEGATTVMMQADITVSGVAAQMSRGLLPEMSKKLTQEFADCLQQTLEASAPAAVGAGGAADQGVDSSPPPAPPAPAKPVSGLSLGLSAIWSLIVGIFKKLFGGGRSNTPV
jgi:hypothetical protein